MSEITWTTGDKYHIRSACGRYTVAKTLVGSVARYGAWRLHASAPPVCLGTAGTADEARAIVQAAADGVSA